ncbi:hypothetical protein GPOL_c32690 [Gordonia polyisoprenivorans VH2]|uniref:Uncharacterized protein n=1 Tax=Gordonia polyisoprenivorans (strain DSM 44266 / VH2) TaxID=1112204 RepID=H6MY56_GORPV|nr:hypothetical protein GPOL_c32690 [Gordonia polyisoprenivorans VH2]
MNTITIPRKLKTQQVLNILSRLIPAPLHIIFGAPLVPTLNIHDIHHQPEFPYRNRSRRSNTNASGKYCDCTPTSNPESTAAHTGPKIRHGTNPSLIRPGISGGLLSREDETYGSRIEAVLG